MTPLAALLLALSLPAAADDKDLGKKVVGQALPDAPPAAAGAPVAAAASVPEPDNDIDKVLRAYGGYCFGLDWRLLKGIAYAESGLDPKNKTGSYEGLFQFDTGGCEDNKDRVLPFPFLSCGDLSDPEVNTAAGATRMDIHLKKIAGVCPAASLEELLLLLYVGHNNGPAVLKHALKKKACAKADQEAAVRDYYEVNGTEQKKIKPSCWRRKGTLPDDCYVLGDDGEPVLVKRRKRVDGDWGAEKWAYGQNVVAAVKKYGAAKAYADGAEDEKLCPATTGKRVFELPAPAAKAP